MENHNKNPFYEIVFSNGEQSQTNRIVSFHERYNIPIKKTTLIRQNGMQIEVKESLYEIKVKGQTIKLTYSEANDLIYIIFQMRLEEFVNL